jgi:endoglucanase
VINLNIKKLLVDLSQIDGPSGFEDPVLEYIEKQISPYVDRTFYNKIGTLIAEKKGEGKEKLGIFAHVDEVGHVVTKIEEGGFARLETVGGVDPKVMFAQRVRIYTKKGIARGVVGVLPPHLQKEEHRKRVPDFDKIFIDVSCSDLGKDVSVGDVGVIESTPVEIGGKICGKALDNRASCAALIVAAELLNFIKNKADVYFIFSSQEEIGGPGAVSVAYQLELDKAIVLDVTHGEAKIPGFPQIKLGNGPALGTGPVVDREFYAEVAELAQKNGVKFQIEPVPGRSGTDTDAVQLTRTGIRTMLVSIPLMYMHTPVEVVDPVDVQETARLIALCTAIKKEG